MRGLLLKEFYVMKRYKNTYLLYLLIFGGAAVFTGNISTFGAMAVVFMTTIPLSSFSVDDYCKWDRMAVSSPVSRKQIIGSKYLLLVICMGASMVLSLVIVGLGALLRPDVMEIGNSLVSVAACIGVMGTMMIVLFPFVIKMGAEKGRMIMMLVFGGVFGLILLTAVLAQNSGMIGNASGTMKVSIALVVTVVMPLILLFATAVSYKISCGIYEKKEL